METLKENRAVVPVLNRLLLFFVLALLALGSGCVTKVAAPVRFERPRGVVKRDLARELSPEAQNLESWQALAPALERSLKYLDRRPREQMAVDRHWLKLNWGQLADSVRELKDMLPELDANASLLATRFEWYRLDPRTLLTGYYEPVINATLEPAPGYGQPLYGPPDDLRTVDLGRFHHRWKGQYLRYRMGEDGIEPYFGREQIDYKGVLEDQGLEVAWAADPVDVFFLHIQGSGRLALPDGNQTHILYAGANGRPYTSLGRVLVDRGHLELSEVSMPAIRAFLQAHPELMAELLSTNDSYVFFKLSDEGPFGATGAALTPMASLAVDPSVVPLGAALVLSGSLPEADGGHRPFTALVLAQDKGGAIKNTRADLFCGSGPEAEFLAGHLKNESHLYLLVSKQALGK